FIFAKLQKLEKLYLYYNEIKTIDNSFKNLKNLQEIYLEGNQLSDNKMYNLFDNLTELRFIDLSYNNLNQFNISKIILFQKLIKLDLSHNNFSNSIFTNWTIFSTIQRFEIDFSHNKLTKFNVEDFYLQLKLPYIRRRSSPKIKFNVDENPIICDCNALELVQFIKKERRDFEIYSYFEIDSTHLKCKTPNNLHDRYLRSLSITELFCDIKKDCPKECKCKRATDNTLIFNCSSSQLQELPTLSKFDDQNSSNVKLYAANNQIHLIQLHSIPNNLTILDLRNNSLQTLEYNVIKRFESIEKLYLTNNQIHSIQLHSIPDNLTILDLRNNSLQTLTKNVIKRFESINKLYLSMNPWTCDCNSEELVNFFHSYRSKIVDADAMMCSDHEAFKSLEPTKLCIQLSQIIIVFLMVTSLLTTVFVLYKKQIKIWLYAHNCCLWWVSEEEADKDMIYDAFFIFSHHDDNFVTDTIIDLEEKGFKCCVHHRDWAAGEMIVTL
ncbi:unnamed protein product, partial [Diamesa tonsa]